MRPTAGSRHHPVQSGSPNSKLSGNIVFAGLRVGDRRHDGLVQYVLEWTYMPIFEGCDPIGLRNHASPTAVGTFCGIDRGQLNSATAWLSS